jgi:hypothetical protein
VHSRTGTRHFAQPILPLNSVVNGKKIVKYMSIKSIAWGCCAGVLQEGGRG